MCRRCVARRPCPEHDGERRVLRAMLAAVRISRLCSRQASDSEMRTIHRNSALHVLWAAQHVADRLGYESRARKQKMAQMV